MAAAGVESESSRIALGDDEITSPRRIYIEDSHFLAVDDERSLSRSTTETQINRTIDIKIEIETETELDDADKSLVSDWIECQFEKEDAIELYKEILSSVEFQEILTDVNEKGNIEIDIRVLLKPGKTLADFDSSPSLLPGHSFDLVEGFSGDAQTFVQLIIDSCNHPMIIDKNVKIVNFGLSFEWRAFGA